MTLREAAREVRRCFKDRDLLTFSSAIAFQVLFALIPLVLFGLGVLGGFGLDEQWTREWAPVARESMSPPAFALVDDTFRQVLGGQQAFWILAGAGLAIWRVSATMRAVMDVFDRIYQAAASAPSPSASATRCCWAPPSRPCCLPPRAAPCSATRR